MAKEYTFGGDALTLANQAVTLAFLNPTAAPSPNFDIMRMWASQQGSATSAQQRIQVTTQTAQWPTLTSTTPRQLKTGDGVASLLVGASTGTVGSVGVNASAETGGAKTTRWGDNFNMLNGYLWVATPREIMSMAGSFASGVNLFLPAAAGSLSNWAVGINYAEGTP